MSEKKDVWDKADVVLRALVPVAVGLMLLAWNNQRTTQQSAAAMTEIAIGILTEEPDEEGVDPLRSWAIRVLQNPSNPPVLSSSAAKELTFRGLPMADFDPSELWSREKIDEIVRKGFSLEEPEPNPESENE